MSNSTQFLIGKKLTRRQSPKQKTSKSSGHIKLLRARVATAESLLVKATEQASQAKRRRKMAKLLARRAKKQARKAKADFDEARRALAEAEAKLATSDARLTVSKPARARAKPVAKTVAAVIKKKAAPAQRAASPTPKAVTQKSAMPVAAKAPDLEPAAEAEGQPIALPQDLASPEAPTAPASSQPHI